MSTSHAPCAACKCRRQKCTQECIFAPYFPPDDPQKFINVHNVFGASNVAKLLNELNPNQREDAVNSLAYEAQYRLQDPVYGCVGLVSILQQKLRQVQHDLECAKKELATYIGPSAMLPLLNHPGLLQQQQNFGHSVYQTMPYHLQQMMFPMTSAHLQQMASVREQEMLRAYVQQQQHQVQQQGQQSDDAGDFVAGFNQMATMQPSLALSGSYESETNHQIQQHVHLQERSHFQSNPLSHPQHQIEQQQSLANHHHLQQKQQQLVQTQASQSQQQTQRATSIGLSC